MFSSLSTIARVSRTAGPTAEGVAISCKYRIEYSESVCDSPPNVNLVAPSHITVRLAWPARLFLLLVYHAEIYGHQGAFLKLNLYQERGKGLYTAGQVRVRLEE